MSRGIPLNLCFLVVAYLFATVFPHSGSAQQLDMEKFEAMKPRSIGPAGMSGRVTAIDAVHGNPDFIYAGTASGGLWRSTSGGIDWEPIFDKESAHSIGAIAINQSNPDVVWVGSGEGNPRNSVSAGNGLFKTIDGGTTWTHLGLDETRSIHRILLHPNDPDIAYVGALGPIYGETEMRGVFKTTDGGESFEKILYENERTGVGDMVMDPSNPDHILVGMWEFRRWPWFFKSGGSGSALHATYDGGRTWKRQGKKDGLPDGELGRIGLAFAESDPNVAYALVEAEKNALFRSENGGDSWEKVNDSAQVTQRPFYYQDIFVDPANENRLYHIHTVVTVSDDAGRSFKQLMQSYGPVGVHPDHHAFWIDPTDKNYIIEGNDGGLNISRDRGKTWRFAENLPVAQFYHINVDMEIPYNVMGGMQDNGSWVGPAYVWRSGGIRNSYWQEVAFGDGFDVSPDPDDSRYGYAMSQGGSLSRYDKKTGSSKYLKPLHPDGEILRFNWNSGFEQDPFDPATIYYGSQYLHKSTDKGNSWDVISPDLTTNDPEKQQQLESGGLTYDVTQAENFTTIVSIGASPVSRGIIWVGTDDGNIQLTRDGGVTWENVAGNIRGVAEGSWVTQIKASAYDEAEAVAIIEDHRRNNWEPYVFRTSDFGRHWEPLVTSDDVWGYALAYAQDPMNPDLQFIGTEFGLYVSVDGGAEWTKWTQGYPTASTMDLVIHPREHDLVIGTFGRSAYVLDDIRPLRAIASNGVEILDEALFVYEAPDAYRNANIQASGTRFRANAIFAGENRPTGARISYSINPDAYESDENDDASADEDHGTDDGEDHGEDGHDSDSDEDEDETPDEVTIEILNSEGDVIRTFDGPAKPGINRTTWNLRQKGVRYPSRSAPEDDAPEPSGSLVLPGTYSARITYGKAVGETELSVHLDPRLNVGTDGLSARQDLTDRLNAMVLKATQATDNIRKATKAVENIVAQLKEREDEPAKDLTSSAESLIDSLEVFTTRFFGPTGKQGIYRNPYTVSSFLGTASSYIGSGYNMPTSTETRAMSNAREELEAFLADVNSFFTDDWPAFIREVGSANIELIHSFEAVSLN